MICPTCGGAMRLALAGIGGWLALVLLGVIQWVLWGEEWTRGYLDALMIAALVLLAWRYRR